MAPKTNAQIQAAYRRRHLKDVDATSARLDILIDQSAKLTLQRMATHYRVSNRAMLERLLSEAQSTLLASLDSDEQGLFYDGAKITG